MTPLQSIMGPMIGRDTAIAALPDHMRSAFEAARDEPPRQAVMRIIDAILPHAREELDPVEMAIRDDIVVEMAGLDWFLCSDTTHAVGEAIERADERPLLVCHNPDGARYAAPKGSGPLCGCVYRVTPSDDLCPTNLAVRVIRLGLLRPDFPERAELFREIAVEWQADAVRVEGVKEGPVLQRGLI